MGIAVLTCPKVFLIGRALGTHIRKSNLELFKLAAASFGVYRYLHDGSHIALLFSEVVTSTIEPIFGLNDVL